MTDRLKGSRLPRLSLLYALLAGCTSPRASVGEPRPRPMAALPAAYDTTLWRKVPCPGPDAGWNTCPAGSTCAIDRHCARAFEALRGASQETIDENCGRCRWAELEDR